MEAAALFGAELDAITIVDADIENAKKTAESSASGLMLYTD